MAISTTQSVWRSGGGDQTRTSICGSMVMSAPFYVANVAATANVTNVSGGQAVVLPAGAVVVGVTISTTGTGNVDLGFTPLTGGVGPGQTPSLGTAVPTGFLVAQSTASKTQLNAASAAAGANMGAVANATNLVVVTAAANGSASGTCSGWIQYFVNNNGAQDV